MLLLPGVQFAVVILEFLGGPARIRVTLSQDQHGKALPLMPGLILKSMFFAYTSLLVTQFIPKSFQIPPLLVLTANRDRHEPFSTARVTKASL